MKATTLIPIAAVLIAGAATVVGVSLTSSAGDAPASPIVVTAPARVPAEPDGSNPPAPAGPAAPAAPRMTADPKVPPPPPPVDVPAPPPAITNGGDDDGDDDGGWDD